MNFFQWTTDYQLYRQQTPKREQSPFNVFFVNRRRELESAGIPPFRLLSERVWEQDGRPYYNVHPKLASRLCKVDMSKIPSTLLKMPHNQRVVNVRLAEQHDEFTIQKEMPSNIGPSFRFASPPAPAGSFAHSVLMVDAREPGGGILPGVGGERSVMFLIDFNVFSIYRQPVYCMFAIAPEEGKSLQEAIDQVTSKRGSRSYDEVIRNVIRLVTSIGFLSDNPTICEPDILAADRSEFVNANDERREFLAARAKRKGKNGYNIGTDIMFLGERPLVAGARRDNPTGRELEYAHIRCGHPHLVRHGEGKKLVKVMWYVPTTVRPDKPFKAED